MKTLQKTTKKKQPQTVDIINEQAKTIAQNLDLADRIEVYGDANAFITLKDHKENFENQPKCRLINPAKTNIGKITTIGRHID